MVDRDWNRKERKQDNNKGCAWAAGLLRELGPKQKERLSSPFGLAVWV